MRAEVYVFLAFVILSGCSKPGEKLSPVALSKAFSDGDTTGFLKADKPRMFSFPADHFAHDGFKTEWWYFTGNVASDKTDFGYQITLFRIAMSPEKQAAAGWKASHFWMGHLAVSNLSDQKFHHGERFSREAAQLAGADSSQNQIWLESWQIDVSDSLFVVSAELNEMEIKLALKPRQKIVLQGDSGLSQKGSSPGNASYYYSIPRLQTTGKIRLNETEFDVKGLSWFDREWSTSMLEKGALGWDWFALHLDDGSDLMYYQLRDSVGNALPFSRGILIESDGTEIALPGAETTLSKMAEWTSPRGGNYPSEWKLIFAKIGMEITVKAASPDQEMQTAVRYWEGAVKVSGKRKAKNISGKGYLEMTGYAAEPVKR